MEYREGCPFVVVRATNPDEQPAFESAYFRAMMRIAEAGIPFRHCTPATLNSLVEAQRVAMEDELGLLDPSPDVLAFVERNWRDR